jgi:diguanylate cyclase (GGDEF)-like protein
LRDGELVARIGGEEFGWVMAETDLRQALSAAERLRRAVSGAPFGEIGRLTLSAGVATLGEPGASGPDEGEALVSAADRALYTAKREGRDRVVPQRADEAP